MEIFALTGLFGYSVREAGMFLSFHRDTSNVAKKRAEGPKEPTILHKKACLFAFGSIIEFSEKKVPVTGVWSYADNTFIAVGYTYLLLPSQTFEKEIMTKFLKHFIIAE